MEKYFKKEKTEKLLLSQYLKKDSVDLKNYLCDEDTRIKRTKYLLDILGDVTLEENIYELFISQFQRFGGLYNVRIKHDTLKAIYEITRKYPMLTAKALEEIWFWYIKDFFEEYRLTAVFDKYIEIFGLQDETFELFIDYVKKKAILHQQKFIEDSLQADELKNEYSEDFVKHIQFLITSQHYTYDEIKKYLPDSELIKKDLEHIIDLSKRTRIHLGCCIPVSYQMFDILIEEKTLDSYPETPTYYISSGVKEQATFTKQEFLDGIYKVKTKVLKKI